MSSEKIDEYLAEIGGFKHHRVADALKQALVRADLQLAIARNHEDLELIWRLEEANVKHAYYSVAPQTFEDQNELNVCAADLSSGIFVLLEIYGDRYQELMPS